MGQGNKPREKKPEWDPLKDYDERAKAYQVERQREAKYNREQGADLPKSLVEQIQNRDKIEQAKGGQYETSVRKGPRQGWHTVTKDIPFEGPFSIMQTEINNLKFAAENATNDQVARSMLNHAISIENEMIAAQEMDNPTTVEVVKKQENKDLTEDTNQLSGGADADLKAKQENQVKNKDETYTVEPGDVETFAEAQAARNEDKQFRDSSSVEDAKKTTFLEDTADSPAAKAGLDVDLRWQARKRYEDFLKKRKVESSLGKAK
tara:strand:- start:40 stop:828 length:789 start_codon:yes stop_codon:yes gene_type:complete